MAQRLTFKELAPQQVSRELRTEFLSVGEALNKELRPRRPVLTVEGDQVRFSNMVGSALLANGDIVEVSPKGDGDVEHWTDAVVQLLEAESRIVVTGSRRSEPSHRRDDLSGALALEYARRLETALRSAGPLEAFERPLQTSRRLNGHLDVTRWTKTATLDPASFPVWRDVLTPRNDFTRGLSIVAGWLSRVAAGELSSRLRRLQSEVIPASPIPYYVNPAVARRQVPGQWAKYKPAWSIAAPLLRQLSVIGDPGRATGLEVAVEPWPLLETSLTRALHALAARHEGWQVGRKGRYPLLSRSGAASVSVIPDGALLGDGSILATFECKYTAPGPTPKEDHVHQALATAAALASPLSVLVYPGDQPARRYEVTGFLGSPVEMVTVGLSLFSYKRGSGDELRADLIEHILNGV